MKKSIFIALAALCLLMAVSCSQEQSNVATLVDDYAQVTIPAPDLSGITDNGKEVLKLYRLAADEVDKIYWEQNYGQKENLLESISDPSERKYAEINYGPWDRIDGKPFVRGYVGKPAGSRFDPSDMSREEF